MEKSKEILKKYWGFENFRPMQEDIVDDSIYGHDVLALLPTGGGKSICFQVPGLAREGITLVISPLIALMQDQVSNLNKKGIRAKAIVSGMSYRDIDITLDNARFGGLEFLYTSPERIQSSLFIERFKRMNVGLIVVDEAHCISEWGHDFRPAFLAIKNLREIHPETPIIALTATATKTVREDIIAQLELKTPKIHEASFERKNISYNCQKTENKISAILEYCKDHQSDCGIIYCQTRRSVKELAQILHVNKLNVGIYHGGLSNMDRETMLDYWMNNRTNIMVATNAFGMGIDKPNVRFVLHYEFPSSLEAYFQEAGRAGRDLQDSETIVFWEEKDIDEIVRRFNLQFPPIETVKLTYRALCNFLKIAIGSGKDETYHFEIKKLCDHFKLELLPTYSSLKILEHNGNLSFTEGVFYPTRLKFAIGNNELYNFQIKHENLRPITTLLSRSYPGIFELFFEINEAEFCKRLKITENELNKQLESLEQFGIIDITWRSNLPTVTFLHERFPDDQLFLKAEVYNNRKLHTESKMDAAINYLMKQECRSVQLLRYFGQESVPCGKCDTCRNENSAEISFESLMDHLKDPKSIRTLVNITKVSEIKLKPMIRKLLLDERISEENGLYRSL